MSSDSFHDPSGCRRYTWTALPASLIGETPSRRRMTAVYVTSSNAVSPAKWICDEVNRRATVLRENRLRKYSTMACRPRTRGLCAGISTPSATHTAPQRSASDAFTAVSHSAAVLAMAARSTSARLRGFIRAHLAIKKHRENRSRCDYIVALGGESRAGFLSPTISLIGR